MQGKGNPVNCRTCLALLGYYHVLVGEIKCKRGHTHQYQVLTESFIMAVQNGEALVYKDDINRKAIALV